MRKYLNLIIFILRISKKTVISILKEFDIFITQKIKKISKSDIENPYNFYDLTPTCDCDKDNKYSNSLKWALHNENIKNIAITGSYGSGKSSILKSFFEKNKGYKVLNISLASFCELSEKKYDKDNKMLELSILQQIFYRVKLKEIPDSRFKRIKNLKNGSILIKTLLFLIWILAILVFVSPSIFQSPTILNIIFYIDYIPLTSLFIILFGFAYIISKLIRIFNNNKINKLNIQSGEIELKNNIDPSILNKHLDEILYFFEVTKYDVVLIEDLDRYKNKVIFSKLREINQLINQSKQINKRIVFIYAIKDDLFLDKDRTKFFDFIIPVIPVINTFNSGNILLNRLIEAKLINKVSNEEYQNISINQKSQNNQVVNNENSKDEIPNSEEQANLPIDSNNLISIEFINDISIYIDDMRLLKNVYNEYILYRDILDSKLNQDNLLAMIIYKNISPSDFADLHFRKGKVYSIFKRKDKFIENKISEIEKDIEKENKKIEDYKNLKIKDVKELRSIYVYAFLKKATQARSFRIENNEVDFKEVLSDAMFTKFQLSPIKYYYDNLDNIKNSGITFNNLEEEVDNELSYQNKEDLILEMNNSFIENTNRKIEQMEKRKVELNEISFQQCSETYSNEEFKEILKDKDNSKNNNELNCIIYLLRNGYINENYEDYISYFFEGFLTKTDRDFIFSIKNRNGLDFNYKLINIDFILKKINIKEFENEETLNIDLLNWFNPLFFGQG